MKTDLPLWLVCGVTVVVWIIGVTLIAGCEAPFVYEPALAASVGPDAGAADAFDAGGQNVDSSEDVKTFRLDAGGRAEADTLSTSDAAPADGADGSDGSDAAVCLSEPTAMGNCGGITFTAPGFYCAYVYDQTDPAGNPVGTPRGVIMPTPSECQCLNRYTCGCLFADGRPWCPAGSSYGVASCGFAMGWLRLVCETGDGG